MVKVLVIAPQPFYQERGTPIAVRLAVETLSRQLQRISGGDSKIDLLVYQEGEDVRIPGVTVIRAKMPRWLFGIRPGISCKKLLCDLLLFFQALSLLWRSRNNQYHVIHAVEESVFIAWIAKKIFRLPYIYDMDSSLSLQLTERWWWCKPALSLLQLLEGIAVRGSIAVAPVCDALQIIAEEHGSSSTVLLRDISLLPQDCPTPSPLHRASLYAPSITDDDVVILYVGNLESYQGIDLLLEAFAHVSATHTAAKLVIVGGTTKHIEFYRTKATNLGCSTAVYFIGPRPVHALSQLLTCSDIVVSPRIKGNNTPMKIYSYLHSGKALLATDLPTHRQVLNDSISLLAEPTPTPFSDALSQLVSDPHLRHQLGNSAKAVAEKLYTLEAFERQMGSLYTTVLKRITPQTSTHSTLVGNA